MVKIVHRVILVIGDKPSDIVKKYSEDTEGNINAFYKYERCQQHRLEVTGEEGDFSDPFPLKNGGKSYSSHYDEIDWDKIHRNPKKTELNGRVWELVVNDDEPRTEQERLIKQRMHERIAYFEDNFNSKENYVNYSSSLWYWGVATDEKYDEVKSDCSDEEAMEWITNFFDRYIKPLKGKNPLITIYEVHSLD